MKTILIITTIILSFACSKKKQRKEDCEKWRQGKINHFHYNIDNGNSSCSGQCYTDGIDQINQQYEECLIN